MTTTVARIQPGGPEEPGTQIAILARTEDIVVPTEVEVVQDEEEEDGDLPESSDAVGDEVFLVIPPYTDPGAVFRFCQSIREIEGVDIAFLSSSAKGITIKLILRKTVPILPTIAMLKEVEKAGRAGIWEEESDGNVPSFLKPNAKKTLSVALRAY